MPPGLLSTGDRVVPPGWADYNGHMNEARYLQAFGDATDRVLALAGCDAGYVAGGHSFFTVETHLRHLGEVLAGQRIAIQTQCLAAMGAKLHLFHRMLRDDALLATGEHLLLHVSLASRRTTPPDDAVAQALSRLAAGHAALPWPEGAGRAVGQR